MKTVGGRLQSTRLTRLMLGTGSSGCNVIRSDGISKLCSRNWGKSQTWLIFSHSNVQPLPFLSSLSSFQYAALGELTQSGRCARTNLDNSIGLIECNAPAHLTTWALHRNGTIAAYNRTNACLSARGNAVRIGDLCDGRLASRWTLNDNNTITESRSGHCLDVLPDSDPLGQSQLVLRECRLRTRRSQIWHFTVKLERTLG